MKRLFLIPVMIVIVVGVILTSCAQQAPAPSPTPTPTLTPSPAPISPPATTSAKPIKLKFSYALPTNSSFPVKIWSPWAEQIKERTTAIGKPVDIAFYGGGALGSQEDQPELVVSGVADMAGCWTPSSVIGRWPLYDAMQLPGLFPSALAINQVARELYNTRSEFRGELDPDFKLLFFQSSGVQNLVTRTRQVKTLEDFKGMKINCSGGIMNAKTLEAVGAVPVTMLPPEVYLSLERGLLDGGTSSWEAIYLVLKWAEVTKYRTVFPRGITQACLLTAMNWNTWNSLPPEDQKIFDELTGAYMDKVAGETFDGICAQCFGLMKEYDKKVGNPEPYVVPEDEFQKWRETLKPVYDWWITDMEAKGLPGKSIYEDVVRLSEKYSK